MLSDFTFSQFPAFQVAPGVDTTANFGDVVMAAGSTTVTLPDVTSGRNGMVIIRAASSVTATNFVTVAYGAGTGGIYGVGVIDQPSFVLGTPNASVVLVCDGTNWLIISGLRDTGWIALSLAPGIVATGGAYSPTARLLGDLVYLRGAVRNNTGSAITPLSPLATIPAICRPAVNLGVVGWVTLTLGAAQITIDASGVLSFQMTASAPSNASFVLDGIVYSIS